MNNMEGCSLKKTVAVVEKNGCATAMLKKIFQLCGWDNYQVIKYEKPLPSNIVKAVLLLCEDTNEEIQTSGWFVCAMEQELSNRATNAVKLITYSLASDNADFTARNVRMTPDGDVAFEIVGFSVIGRVRLKGMTLSEVGGALAAASAAVGAGVPFADVLKALNDPQDPNCFHSFG